MIKIKKSPTADSRSCDVKQVSKSQLQHSTRLHIKDVQQGITWFIAKLIMAAKIHDHTKLQFMDDFYEQFQNNFKTTKWWRYHQVNERHHISAPFGHKDDVDLVDVIQYMVDGVVAGMARTGEYYYQQLPQGLLQTALKNTIDKLLKDIKVQS